MTSEGTPTALDGIRIVEVAAGRAVAYAGKLFAQSGAEVIRIEPPGGDAIRNAGPFPGDNPDPNAGGWHEYLNGGKRSVVLDLTTAEGAAAAGGLIEQSVMLLTSWKTPGEIPFADAEAMRARFPNTIYVSISPFGRTGPYADYYDADSHILEAIAGYSYVTGYPDREPLSLGVEVADYFGGVYGWVSGLAVLNARQAGEEHHFVDISGLETLTLADDHNLAIYQGMGMLRRRFYSRVLGAYPSDIMRCRDGYVSVVPGAPDFATAMALLIDRPDLIDHPLLQRPRDRVVQWREFDAMIQPWLLEHDAKEIVEKANELRLAFALVPTVQDLLENDPHLQAREFFPQVDGHPEVGPPVRLSESPLRVADAPDLGEGNRELVGQA
jgi:crotonobetainyl-CoA:carnitine CoA-transferase CaiB-like acyl-CoA transferase